MISNLNIVGKSPLTTKFVAPKKICYVTSGVTDSENLLNITSELPQGSIAKFSTKNGQKAALLLDFGSEITGGIRIDGHCRIENNGCIFKIMFGESAQEAMTPNGVKHAQNDHSVRDAEVRMSINNGTSFGKTAFRFVYLELISKEVEYDVSNICAEFSFRDIEYKGSFSCNDELLNKIFDTCAYTVHLCMQEALFDGAQRDRWVWTGDMRVETLTISKIFGDIDIIDKSLKHLLKKTSKFHGEITTYDMWYIIILEDWMKCTGRTELLYELKEAFIKKLNSVLDLFHEDKNTLFCEDEFKFAQERGYYIDWPTRNTKESESGAIALSKLCLDAAINLCRVLNENDLMSRCIKTKLLYKDVIVSYNDKKQIAALLNLAGLIDNEHAGEALIKDGCHGFSTFMSYYILKAISNSVGIDKAIELLKEYYGAMLDVGATTFWEDFDIDWYKEDATIEHVLNENEYDIHGDNGNHCYKGFRHSLCQGWSSGPAAFIVEDIMGIKILENGCKRLLVEPKIGKLQWVKGTYPTPYGIMELYLHKENEKICIDISCPKEISLEIDKNKYITQIHKV
ncbi:MAG: hypothetical protein IJO62_03300 [Clostridia bacterium]|nr:hypothetical protein [Clostridia bacterium]